MTEFSPAWLRWRQRVDLDEYEQRWDKQAATGVDVHGEADLIHALALGLDSRTTPVSILDAGCGMGRVGIELSLRGHQVTGIDLDPDLLARARRRLPTIDWIQADLATLDLPMASGADAASNSATFDVIAMAGNVLPFVKDGDRAKVVDRLGHHLSPGGLLVAGFSVNVATRPAAESEPPTAEDYLRWCADTNLVPSEAWSSWDRAPLTADPGYRVFVHQK